MPDQPSCPDDTSTGRTHVIESQIVHGQMGQQIIVDTGEGWSIVKLTVADAGRNAAAMCPLEKPDVLALGQILIRLGEALPW